MDLFKEFSVPKVTENKSFRVVSKLKKYWNLNLPEFNSLVKLTILDKIYLSNLLCDNAIRVAKFSTKYLNIFREGLSNSNKKLGNDRFCCTESLKFQKAGLNNSIYLSHAFFTHFDVKKTQKSSNFGLVKKDLL